MRVSLIQKSLEWLAAERNRESAEGWIAQCSTSQLVVLPEMFTTGFCVEPGGRANGGAEESGAESGEQTKEWMCRMAAKYNTTIVGSVAVEQCGRYYNRMYVVGPGGEVESYDKRHLFSFAGEHHHYVAGDRRIVVEVEGVRILLLICYDLRFPVWARNRGDYDMIVCVANWPASRRGAWDTLLRARAIENLAYVGGVNIVGDDPTAHYSGGTVGVDYKGDEMSSVADECEGVATFDIDLQRLRAFREKFSALSDADEFELKLKQTQI